jgi:hypothetical protein
MKENTQGSFAEEAVGVAPPRAFLALDASVLDQAETHRILKEDVKQNRVEYIFPEGFSQVDLLEECRALTMPDDFDTMYDLTMQLLTGKPVTVNIKNLDGSKTELCRFQVVDRYQNLRGVEAINEYPCLVTWLTEFISAYLSKKYPTPGTGLLPPREPGGTGGGKTRLTQEESQETAEPAS